MNPGRIARDAGVCAISRVRERLAQHLSRSRTLDEVTRELAALRDKISERRDAYEREYQRTSKIIESRFDENVRRAFKYVLHDPRRPPSERIVDSLSFRRNEIGCTQPMSFGPQKTVNTGGLSKIDSSAM